MSEIYWYGCESSLKRGLDVMAKSSDTMAMAKFQGQTQPEEPMLFSEYRSVGLINISGPLLSKSSWLSRALGMSSYPDIRDALVYASAEQRIKSILLNIDSPGGAVTGLEDVSNVINMLDKPVYAHTSTMMASAGYWIGVSADKVFSTRLATVGSIGTIMTHFDETQYLANEGIKVTVIRSAPYKALGGPFEPMAGDALQVATEKVQTLHDHFVAHVSERLGLSRDFVSGQIANGKDYFGYEAFKLGMIQGIKGIDQLVHEMDTKFS